MADLQEVVRGAEVRRGSDDITLFEEGGPSDAEPVFTETVSLADLEP